jgi:hypothetical protein
MGDVPGADCDFALRRALRAFRNIQVRAGLAAAEGGRRGDAKGTVYPEIEIDRVLVLLQALDAYSTPENFSGGQPVEYLDPEMVCVISGLVREMLHGRTPAWFRAAMTRGAKRPVRRSKRAGAAPLKSASDV